MAEYSPICAADELAPGTAKKADIGGKAIAVFNVDGVLYAMEDTCLHAGGPLHQGTLDGTIVTCPWHEWQFDVRDGSCSLNPLIKLTCFPVRVRDGVVEVKVSA